MFHTFKKDYTKKKNLVNRAVIYHQKLKRLIFILHKYKDSQQAYNKFKLDDYAICSSNFQKIKITRAAVLSANVSQINNLYVRILSIKYPLRKLFSVRVNRNYINKIKYFIFYLQTPDKNIEIIKISE